MEGKELAPKIIVVKFEEISLKFEKVRDNIKFIKVRKSSRCTFNHNYYQKTPSYMGLGLCNLRKTTEINKSEFACYCRN